MKRSDVHVGDVLYWRKGILARGYKVRVVDTGNWKEISDLYRRRGEPNFREDPHGRFVLVDVYGYYKGDSELETVRKAVLPVHLLGPYDKVKLVIDAEQQIENERIAAERATRASRGAEKTRLMGVATRLGLDGIYDAGAGQEGMYITPTTLEILLGSYEKNHKPVELKYGVE